MTVLSGPKPRLPANLRAQGNYSAVEFCLGCMHHAIKTWAADLSLAPESPALKFVFYSCSITNGFQWLPEPRGLQSLKQCRDSASLTQTGHSEPSQTATSASSSKTRKGLCENRLDGRNTLVFETFTSSRREINKSIQTQGDCAMVEGGGERVVLRTRCLF